MKKMFAFYITDNETVVGDFDVIAESFIEAFRKVMYKISPGETVHYVGSEDIKLFGMQAGIVL